MVLFMIYLAPLYMVCILQVKKSYILIIFLLIITVSIVSTGLISSADNKITVDNLTVTNDGYGSYNKTVEL